MLYEISRYDEAGFKIVFQNDKWRIAILNSIPELLRENLGSWERHTETDEAFLLLEGNGTMVIAGDKEERQGIECVPLNRNEVFTVKQFVWHTIILSKDAKVLIIENTDTDETNTMRGDMTSDEKQTVTRLTA